MVRPVVLVGVRPLEPERLRFGQRHLGVDRLRQGLVGWEPGQHERHPIAGPDDEIGDRRQSFAVDVDRGAQAEGVRAGNRDASIVDAPHPGDDMPVVEADDQLGPHRHSPRDPFHDADDIGRLSPRRHEVDDADAPLRRLVDRLQDQGQGPVAALAAANLRRRRQEPASMLRFAQERGEAGAGVESRETAPVDRPGAMHQHRRLQVAKERVVFDSSGIAHAAKRTPRMLERRRNIVSSRGAGDLVKHSVRTRERRSLDRSGDRARRGHLTQATCACSHRIPALDVELQEGESRGRQAHPLVHGCRPTPRPAPRTLGCGRR